MLGQPVALTLTPSQGIKLCLLTLALCSSILSNGQSGCNSPQDLQPKIENDSTVYFTWALLLTPGASSSIYDAEYRETPFGPWTKAFFPYGNDAEHAWITNARRGTCYEMRVRTICTFPDMTRDTTQWTSLVVNTGAAFCTTAPPQTACTPPNDLLAQLSNDSTATFSWGKTLASSTYYETEIRELNSLTWNKGYFPYGNDFEHSRFENIAKGKCYELRVRTICLFSDRDTTAWASTILNTGNPSCPNAPPSPPAQQPYVNPNFTYSIDPCFPSLVSFSNNTTMSGTTIKSAEWDLGDNTRSTSNNPVHSYQKPGNYTVTMTIYDVAGKSYTKTVIITIMATKLRFANAGDDQTVCSRDSVSLNASGGQNYSWSPCTGLSGCNISNPRVGPGTSMIYILTATNGDGCLDRDTVSIKYIEPSEDIYIPNAFTPNHDGLNDLFNPLVSLRGHIEAEWKIFNRFGNILFSTNNPLIGWDGKFKGELQPAGNYGYILKTKAMGGCPSVIYKGTVLLLR